jgi:hypothetical protein
LRQRSINGSHNPPQNSSGWNKPDVTVTFNCADSLSGVISCLTTVILTSEGANQSVNGVSLDYALNQATASINGINLIKRRLS